MLDLITRVYSYDLYSFTCVQDKTPAYTNSRLGELVMQWWCNHEQTVIRLCNVKFCQEMSLVCGTNETSLIVTLPLSFVCPELDLEIWVIQG